MRDFHLPGRSSVMAQNAMCATSHPLAAQTAIDILKSGGNAMDAAIAAAVLLGICEPGSTGIGGDCFVLWSKPNEPIRALNGSGRAPSAASAAALRDKGLTSIPLFSAPDAVSIPGAIDAFCHLAETVGVLGIDRLLAPTIEHAEKGVPVAGRAAFDWANTQTPFTHSAEHYLNAGKPFTKGDLFRAPGQAEVLRRVSKEGRAGFYEGEVAEDMVASLNALGGVHTLDDFASTACTPTEPISGSYKDLDLVEHPPNGQGATAILMLNILAQFDIAAMDPWGTERAHIEAEAAKLAYDARDRFIADADYTTRLEHMLSLETARKLAALIDPKRAMAAAKPVSEAVHKDTVYLTVVDRDGMAVSMIYSIFHGFGSGISSSKFGVLFQNRGAGFTLEEGHPNELAGGKRPMHTIIPGMLCQNGSVIMPFGVMGGAYQPNGHARFVTNVVDFGLDPQEAIDAPRAFSETGTMNVERGYTDQVRSELAEIGHKVEIPTTPIGGAQAIRIHPSGVLEGGSDPRKDGCAIGY